MLTDSERQDIYPVHGSWPLSGIQKYYEAMFRRDLSHEELADIIAIWHSHLQAWMKQREESA